MQLVCFRLMFYSFCGWVLEEIYQFFTKGTFIKPNFLLGPFKPMYGIAAVLLLAVKKFGKKAFFFWAQIISLGVEYISGLWLKKSFGLQYWDYSKSKYNLQGLICWEFAIIWIILAYGFAYLLQPKLAQFDWHKKNVKITLWSLWGCFLWDIVFTLIRRSGGKIN